MDYTSAACLPPTRRCASGGDVAACYDIVCLGRMTKEYYVIPLTDGRKGSKGVEWVLSFSDLASRND